MREINNLSAMFIDLRGFTSSIQNGTQIPVVWEGLQRFYRMMHGYAMHSDSLRFIKTIGDEALYTGKPKDVVNAGMSIIEDGWDVDIGIATGRILEGFMGPPGFECEDVIGKAVNLAARLETVGEHRLVVCVDTFDQLGRKECFEKIPIDVKGHVASIAYRFVADA
jgi:class 3 adenylate cyclase